MWGNYSAVACIPLCCASWLLVSHDRHCLVVSGGRAGTCSRRSWTSPSSIGNCTAERQSTCRTSTERGKAPLTRLFTGPPRSVVCWGFQSCDLKFQKPISSRSLDTIFTKCFRIPVVVVVVVVLVVIEYQDGHGLLLIMLRSDFIKLLPIGLVVKSSRILLFCGLFCISSGISENLSSVTLLWINYYVYRMIKDKFEEDDGIDMNDIERFLPHLHSVSLFPSCIFFYVCIFI